MKITNLKLNESNPRFIKDDKFKKLVKSIEEFPKMLELRPIVYNPETMEILGGNMRYRALKELKYKEIPDKWIKSAESLTEEEKKRFIIEDNVSFGDWDFEMLANDWDEVELEEWGVELPIDEDMPEIITNDNFENSKNPNDVYGGNSCPVRIASLICYITDEQLKDKIFNFTDKINEKLGDGEEAQKARNEIGSKILNIILNNENSICK